MASPLAPSNLTYPSAASRGTHHRGFSIVELLVVIAIIIALLGTLLVALSHAGKRAQSAQTQVLMTSISNALASFERDIGYLPPSLGDATSPTVATARDYFVQPNWVLSGNTPTSQSVADYQRWYSYTALPEYLLGYGNRTQDGHGVFDMAAAPAGSPGSREPVLGIRHPGDDGYWNGVNNPRQNQPMGALSARNIVEVTGAYNATNANNAVLQGKVFGPYIELADSTNIAAIQGYNSSTGEPNLVFAGDDPNFDSLPKVFVDYWGSPIEYYRRPYIIPDLKSKEEWGSNVLGRDLGDIFALRPGEFKPGEDRPGVPDANGDDSTLARLKTARYALLSRGPDKSVDRTTRRDENGFNRDNIVEAGQ